MRLVIDLQGAQGTSRLRGIGRYSRELALAMTRAPGPHEVVLALNAGLPSDDLVDAFAGVLPFENIRFWHGGGDSRAVDRSTDGRRAVSTLLRAEFLASLQPDLVHISSLFEGASDSVVTRWPSNLARLPTVATCYDLIPLIHRADYLDGAWKDSSLGRWYFGQLREMMLCDGLLAISDASRLSAIDLIRYPADRIHNIRAGISPDFAPRHLAPEQAEALYRRYGLRPGFILFVGGGDIRKNEAGLIAAFGLLPEALRARHQLVIVGQSDPDQLARSAVFANVPLDQIVLIRFVEEADLPALYSLCGVSVLPSLHEGFGFPAAEAMACGAPTIASDNSSLPEVLGRPDALFDAKDPADIAARLQAVLTDEAFRADLAAHGPRQAGTFTWEDSARRAWAGLEAIAAATARPKRTAPLARLPRLAFVSPLPPQESGISDYALDLLPALARHYDITLVSDLGMTNDEMLDAQFPVISSDMFVTKAAGFDRVLYQIGNSEFHLRQIEQLLPAVPGVVTLHDAFNSGVLYWRAWMGGNSRQFLLDLLRSHGWPAVVLAERAGLDVAVARFPCSLPVLQAAIGVVQHSAHAKSIMTEHFSRSLAAQIRIIPLLRHEAAPVDRNLARQALGVPAEAFLVCSFGLVSKTKFPELIVEAFSLFAKAVPNARLVFVGEPLNEVLDLFATQGTADAPFATGRVDNATYRQWLAAADVAVQLRTMSRGETSRAVADCLGAGLALIVNAHGSLEEMPDRVVAKLPEHPEAAELAATLRHLHENPEARRALGRAAQDHAMTELDPKLIGDAYHDVIEAFYHGRDAVVASRLLHESASHLADDEAEFAAAARAIAATFPRPRPAQLLLACGALGDLPESLRTLLRDCLERHPPAIRVHLVCRSDDRLRQDWATVCAHLNLAPLPGEAPTIDAGPGDVFVELSEGAVAASDRRELMRHGVRVVSFGETVPRSAEELFALLEHRAGCAQAA
jgi:glycosyltransferase involved in cell wall biosynthesis